MWSRYAFQMYLTTSRKPYMKNPMVFVKVKLNNVSLKVVSHWAAIVGDYLETQICEKICKLATLFSWNHTELVSSLGASPVSLPLPFLPGGMVKLSVAVESA